MFLALPVEYRHCNKNSSKRRRSSSTRNHSHGEIPQNANHCRNNSTNSIDVFQLTVPPNADSTLSHLICSMCSLPMTKPTVLPCQHTFCFKCLENSQNIRSSSLSTHSNSYLLSNTNSKIVIKCQKCSCVHNIKCLADLEENKSTELLINTLLCEQCDQLCTSKQLDTCSNCFSVICSKCYDEHMRDHQKGIETNENLYKTVLTEKTKNISMKTNSNRNDENLTRQIFKKEQFNNDEEHLILSNKSIENQHNENLDSSQTNKTRKKSTNFFHKIINVSYRRRLIDLVSKDTIKKDSISIPTRKTSSTKYFRRKTLTINNNMKAASSTEITQRPGSVTPIEQFLNSHEQHTIAVQHIQQYKQRQLELDRTVRKLIEVLTLKTNENINHITQNWIDFKRILLDKYQSKFNRFLPLDYLLKMCCSNSDSWKQIDVYIAQNNNIKSVLETLSITLTSIIETESLVTISKLFDHELQATIRNLNNQLESLLSSYSDGLLCINEIIHVYESRLAAWKDSNLSELNILAEKWTQIVKEDYPSLVKTISDDFITTVPQIENVLIEMLNNMQKIFCTLDKSNKLLKD